MIMKKVSKINRRIMSILLQLLYMYSVSGRSPDERLLRGWLLDIAHHMASETPLLKQNSNLLLEEVSLIHLRTGLGGKGGKGQDSGRKRICQQVP